MGGSVRYAREAKGRGHTAWQLGTFMRKKGVVATRAEQRFLPLFPDELSLPGDGRAGFFVKKNADEFGVRGAPGGYVYRGPRCLFALRLYGTFTRGRDRERKVDNCRSAFGELRLVRS